MQLVQFCLGVLFAVFIYIVITKVLMAIANFIGEVLGLRRLISFLLGLKGK